MTLNVSSTPSRSFVAAVVVIGLVAVALTAGPVAGQAPAAGVTFTKQIAPILQRSCENCHRVEPP